MIIKMDKWLEESYEKYPPNNFEQLWLPEYIVLDNSINDILMPERYVICGNPCGNIELPRIIDGKLRSSFTINYCVGAYKIQTSHKFSSGLEIYNPVKTIE